MPWSQVICTTKMHPITSSNSCSQYLISKMRPVSLMVAWKSNPLTLLSFAPGKQQHHRRCMGWFGALHLIKYNSLSYFTYSRLCSDTGNRLSLWFIVNPERPIRPPAEEDLKSVIYFIFPTKRFPREESHFPSKYCMLFVTYWCSTGKKQDNYLSCTSISSFTLICLFSEGSILFWTWTHVSKRQIWNSL